MVCIEFASSIHPCPIDRSIIDRWIHRRGSFGFKTNQTKPNQATKPVPSHLRTTSTIPPEAKSSLVFCALVCLLACLPAFFSFLFRSVPFCFRCVSSRRRRVGPVVVPGVVAADPLAGQPQGRERDNRVRRHASQQRGHLQAVPAGDGPHLRGHARGDLGGPLLQKVSLAGLIGVVVREVVSPEHPLDLLLGLKGRVGGAGLESVQVQAGQD
mmetsp:Transcript_24107/g.66827  ORF Transcript_24107/g.66827 Transcript_24107/m.66827 type:complete len:212 (+) Transcript_24107:101-736(+)